MAMKKIGAFEAKNKFGQLLDWVEAGDEVVITRRGKVVARLVPPPEPSTARPAHEVAARIRARRKGVTLGGLNLKELIAEGAGERGHRRVVDASRTRRRPPPIWRRSTRRCGRRRTGWGCHCWGPKSGETLGQFVRCFAAKTAAPVWVWACPISPGYRTHAQSSHYD
jgi:prevent-host-death family protein